MTEEKALAAARQILGPRALVRRGEAPYPCRVLRAEMTIESRRYEREFGRGISWQQAIESAQKAHEAMMRTARLRKAG